MTYDTNFNIIDDQEYNLFFIVRSTMLIMSQKMEQLIWSIPKKKSTTINYLDEVE